MVKEKLRTIRENKGITQKQIAASLPTDTSNYNRKELGEVKITKREWDVLAKFLEVSVEEIYEEHQRKTSAVKFQKPTFNDNSTNIGIQYVEIMPSLVENLQDLIAILKQENQNLTEENQLLKEKIKLLEGE